MMQDPVDAPPAGNNGMTLQQKQPTRRKNKTLISQMPRSVCEFMCVQP